MAEHQLVALAGVFVLGSLAQWIAWRLRLPSILLLLGFGFLAGPVFGFVNPDELLGELLFPVVSLSVAVILFEGSLSLQLGELREIGRVLGYLLTFGAGITWLLTTLAAYFVLGLEFHTSLLLGALLVVTGPTVIGPLLRQIRPIGRVGPIARWEGIVIDPVGAVLAVLVFEAEAAIQAARFDIATLDAASGLMGTVASGVVFGLLAGVILEFVLTRHYVPDYLQSPVTLMFVFAAFVSSNVIKHESGLAAVTIMGVYLANRHAVPLRHILEFKENLTVVLVSSLFILLTARLDPLVMMDFGWRGLLFCVVMILVVRPVSVFFATLGSPLTWAERGFLAWLAPRGIVAAAVASVFAIRLGPEAGHGLVPATFLVIAATVVVYGLTAFPLARRLGLAMADPQGVLIASAHAGARAIAHGLQEAGFPVLLVDTNHWNIQQARMEGLRTAQMNILSEQTVNDLDLGGIGRFLGMTSNDGVNSLAALRLADIFGRAEVYQFTPIRKAEKQEEAAHHLRARFLFGPDVTYEVLDEKFAAGWRIKITKLTQEFDYAAFRAQYGDEALVLFTCQNGQLTVRTTDSKSVPTAGQKLIAMVAPDENSAV
ncbi:sodium:proton antiporter [Maioricimonas sp. JC845]|uniref:cation:proton antiporter n=1 Tax=Maioricimonas sp. JC845 TaxID=3232138 RepID=UPI003458269C